MALPKYDQIAGDIRGRIVRGELKAGDTLPSERELTERWSVARATVVRARRMSVRVGQGGWTGPGIWS